jgi:adenylate kinase
MASYNPHLTEEQRLIKRWLGSGSINIFGRPFAGKDTQAARLASWLEAPVIGGGDIIRNSDVPIDVRQHEQAGMLVSQQSYLDLVTPYLQRQEFRSKPLILSSVGRWYGEEYSILESARDSVHHIMCVIYIALTPEATEARFQDAHTDASRTARADHHTLETRLAEFDTKTQPVLNTYRELGLLEEINGDGTIEEVERRIISALFTRALKALSLRTFVRNLVTAIRRCTVTHSDRLLLLLSAAYLLLRLKKLYYTCRPRNDCNAHGDVL